MSRTPPRSARRANSGALIECWSQPSRIFSVTGTATAATAASMRREAWSRSRMSAEPAYPLVTRLAGQPMLMSMMSAPLAAAIRAPSPIQCGSHPASWTAWSASPTPAALSCASPSPDASASLAVISEITSPAPSCTASRRNGASVIPDMGATRQASVRAGLEALVSHGPEIVLVHDAARPFASPALISRAIEAVTDADAAIPGIPVSDTVKAVDDADQVVETLDRMRLRMIQTPQAFRFSTLLDVHRRAAAEGREGFTDDAALAEWAGLKVCVFEGEAGNIKLTTPEDFARAQSEPMLADLRTGTGFDVHAFGEGDHVALGGVRIPHGRGLIGHSDADVALHALTDALLGALADGDLGVHFPPSDPQWRNGSSDRFLAFAAERVRRRGGRINHLDVTIVCEAPRIGPHRDAMRTRPNRRCSASPRRCWKREAR